MGDYTLTQTLNNSLFNSQSDNMGANLLQEQAYQNQNFLQYNPDVNQPSVNFSDKEIQARAIANFETKPLFVLGGYNKNDAYYNPNGIAINKALGK